MLDDRSDQHPHAGVVTTGDDGVEGGKAFYILIEALPGREEEVMQMLRDIQACVEDEPATGPWYAARHSPTRFAIFEAFTGRRDASSRLRHVPYARRRRTACIRSEPSSRRVVEPRTRQPDLMTSQFKLPAGGGGCRDHGSSRHGVST